MDEERLSPTIRQQFDELGVDARLTLRILDAYNQGRYDGVEAVTATALPRIDGRSILDLTDGFELRLPLEHAEAAIERLGVPMELRRIGVVDEGELTLDTRALEGVGRRLYPLVAYGVLNGGSATSYTDLTKNRAFNETVFDICAPTFERIAEISSGRPKGITPAFVHPDGSPGPSYVELKMRSLLIEELRYRALTDLEEPALFPMFQMTSVRTDEEIRQAYARFKDEPLLKGLIARTGVDITEVLTGVQPLIAAFTPESAGRPKELFTTAFGERERILPLPGGHGQNFEILREVYTSLHKAGKRFVILGNVDNLGNTLDPVEIALVALSGKQAGFDFAFKTPVDVKGGILVVDQRGRIDCADIGPAISREEVLAAESRGTPILFNCATGLFDLDYLVSHLDAIIERLPMRWSNQEKDAGRYAQAEQVTWEIIGMLDDFYIFGVNKFRRFLAAKLLIESLITSGIGIADPRFPTDEDPSRDLARLAAQLHEGLRYKLENSYGFALSGQRWEAVPVDRLISSIGGQS